MAGGFAALLTGFAGQAQNGQPGCPPSARPEFEHAGLRDRRQRRRAAADPRHHRDDPGVPAPHGHADLPHQPRRGAGGRRQADRLRPGRRAVRRWRASPSTSSSWGLRRRPGRGPVAHRARTCGSWPAPGAVWSSTRVIGVGVGALVRNQVGAIVGALVYLYVVEPMSGRSRRPSRRLQVDARRRAAGDDGELPGARAARALAGRAAAARLRSARRAPGHAPRRPARHRPDRSRPHRRRPTTGAAE